MVSASFGSFDTTVLFDGLESDGEDIDAADAPDDDVAYHPMLVGVPCVRACEGLGAWAFRAREGKKHHHEEERELHLPEHRHVDGRDDRKNEA